MKIYKIATCGLNMILSVTQFDTPSQQHCFLNTTSELIFDQMYTNHFKEMHYISARQNYITTMPIVVHKWLKIHNQLLTYTLSPWLPFTNIILCLRNIYVPIKCCLLKQANNAYHFMHLHVPLSLYYHTRHCTMKVNICQQVVYDCIVTYVC